MQFAIVLSALFALAVAYPQHHHHGESYQEIKHHDKHEVEVHLKAHPEYHYGWDIHDDKHHVYTHKKEDRDGYKVKGEYSLVQPDGHKRIVHYEADKKTGWQAHVEYVKHH